MKAALKSFSINTQQTLTQLIYSLVIWTAVHLTERCWPSCARTSKTFTVCQYGRVKSETALQIIVLLMCLLSMTTDVSLTWVLFFCFGWFHWWFSHLSSHFIVQPMFRLHSLFLLRINGALCSVILPSIFCCHGQQLVFGVHSPDNSFWFSHLVTIQACDHTFNWSFNLSCLKFTTPLQVNQCL